MIHPIEDIVREKALGYLRGLSIDEFYYKDILSRLNSPLVLGCRCASDSKSGSTKESCEEIMSILRQAGALDEASD